MGDAFSVPFILSWLEPIIRLVTRWNVIIQVSVFMETIVVNSDCVFENIEHQSSKWVACRSLTTILAIVIIGHVEQSISQNIFFSTDTS